LAPVAVNADSVFAVARQEEMFPYMRHEEDPQGYVAQMAVLVECL
jgi:hypothetical protein